MTYMLCVSPKASKAIRHLLFVICSPDACKAIWLNLLSYFIFRLMPLWLYGICCLFCLFSPDASVAIRLVCCLFSPDAPVAIWHSFCLLSPDASEAKWHMCCVFCLKSLRLYGSSCVIFCLTPAYFLSYTLSLFFLFLLLICGVYYLFDVNMIA